MKSILSTASLLAIASAFTQPVQPPTYGALLTPDLNTPVTTGENYVVSWSPKQPADGVTVSLVLCNGPSSNCVLQSSAIAEGISAAAGSYSWSVPCSLPEGTQGTDSGYGMLIIVDGTGEFQYSTQFSVIKGSSCSSSISSTSSPTSPPSGPTGPTSPAGPTGTNSGSTWLGWTSSAPPSTPSSMPPFTFGPSSSNLSSSSWTTVMSNPYSSPTSAYVTTSATSATSAAATSAKPSQFTGAAAVPSAFVNMAAGLVGAAGFAMLAL